MRRLVRCLACAWSNPGGCPWFCPCVCHCVAVFFVFACFAGCSFSRDDPLTALWIDITMPVHYVSGYWERTSAEPWPTATAVCCVGAFPSCQWSTYDGCAPTVTPITGPPTPTPPILPVPTDPPSVTCSPRYQVSNVCAPTPAVTVCAEPGGISFVTADGC